MPTLDTTTVQRVAGTSTYRLLGTAGHIDHGKTLLVKALTGVDTDRLPEERLRGMTIELGFAKLAVGDTCFGVVDVPGHERFVRTMVAGATGIDMALIVVAADDSVMPQTVEHVEILQLLGVNLAVAAVTKIDMVGSDMVDLVVEDVRSLLAGRPFENAPICRVSSTTGEGLEALRAAILAESRRAYNRPCDSPFRMAVDRVFTVRGRGTVVTGSILRGSVSISDVLEIWPEGRTCRVRGLETHGNAGPTILCGQRAAINLTTDGRTTPRRGSELATPGYVQPSRVMDVRLHCLSSSERPIRSASVARLEIGTRDARVRMVLYEGGQIEPGRSALAQLRLGESVPAAHGQRFIIRNEGAARTIGGGVILRPFVRRRERDIGALLAVLRFLESGDDEARVAQVLRMAGFARPSDLQICALAGVELADLERILDRLRAQQQWVLLADAGVCVVPDAIDDLGKRLAKWLERHHGAHADEPGRKVDSVVGWLGRVAGQSLARPLLDRFLENGVVKRFGSFVCLPGFAPRLTGSDEKMLAAILDEMRTAGFQPPSLDTLSTGANADRKRLQRLSTLAAALGELKQIDADLCLHADNERRLRETVAELIRRNGRTSVSEVREALGSSRKYVVPFLEYLDRIGFTRRNGDYRTLADDGEQ